MPTELFLTMGIQQVSFAPTAGSTYLLVRITPPSLRITRAVLNARKLSSPWASSR